VLIFIAIGVAFIAFPQFGNQALIVRSGSMSPTIDVGSVAVIKKTDSNTYKTGDVIAFRSEKNKETITTHRVVDAVIEGNQIFYRTQGDANDDPDAGLVRPGNILGKTYIVIPYVGQVLAFAKSDIGFPALIIFPAVFVILIEVWSIIKEVRKRKELRDSLGFVNYDLKRSHTKNLFTLKLLIPLLVISLFIPSTFAFFSDSETSTGNTFTAAASFPQTSNLFVSNGYTCSGGASDTSVSKGTVTIAKTSDLKISVTLVGTIPNTSYDLWVNQDPGACPLSSPTVSGFITTDGSGNGSNTLNNHTLVSSTINFWVSMVGGSDVLRSAAVSF